MGHAGFPKATPDPQKEKELLKFISDTPELQSVLYDIDLLPEQLEKGSREWSYMLALALVWKAYISDLTRENDHLVETLKSIRIGLGGIAKLAEEALITSGVEVRV